METVLPILLMGAAGLLAGGTYSMAKQRRTTAAVICGLLALVSLAASILWLWPQGGNG